MSLAGDIVNFSLCHAWSHNGKAARTNSWVLDKETWTVVHLSVFSGEALQALTKQKYSGKIQCKICQCTRETNSIVYPGPLGTVNVICVNCGGPRNDKRCKHSRWTLCDSNGIYAA